MKAILIVLALFCGTAQANSIRDWFAIHGIDVEASIGSAQAQMPPDGQYWQEPFKHQFKLQGQAASLGVTGTFAALRQSMRWRLYGLYLGKFSGSADAVQDEQYDPRSPTGCVSAGCGGFNHYDTEMTTRGIVGTLAPEFRLGGFTLSPEFGLHAYIPKMDERVSNTDAPSANPSYDYHYKGGWNLGKVWGFGVAYGKARVSVKRYEVAAKAAGTDVPTSIGDIVTVVSAEVRF